MGNYQLSFVGGKGSWSMCDCRKKAVALAHRTDALASNQRLCPECLTRFVAEAKRQGFTVQADPKLQRYLPGDETTSNSREAGYRAAGPGANPYDPDSYPEMSAEEAEAAEAARRRELTGEFTPEDMLAIEQQERERRRQLNLV